MIGDFVAQHSPGAIVNLAPETDAERSNHGPANFIEMNVVGKIRLLG